MQGLYRFAFCTFVFALFLMTARAAFAQSTGGMSGMVQDPSGGSVPVADITVRNLETNAVLYSPRWAQMLGYEIDEIEPHVRAWERLLHPDDMDRAQVGCCVRYVGHLG